VNDVAVNAGLMVLLAVLVAIAIAFMEAGR